MQGDSGFRVVELLRGEQLKSGWEFSTLQAAVTSTRKSTLVLDGAAPMTDLNLTPEQEAEAQRLAAFIGKRAQDDAGERGIAQSRQKCT